MSPEPAELLHNMSAPPKTVVQFEGLHALKGTVPNKDQQPAVHGAAFRFRVHPQVLELKPAQLLQAVDPASRVRVHARAGQLLMQRIEQRAQELPLPDGCLVVPPAPTHLTAWTDLLTTLAVLTKATETVWLRAKLPSLEVAHSRFDVSLYVPRAFLSRIPVTTAQGPTHG